MERGEGDVVAARTIIRGKVKVGAGNGVSKGVWATFSAIGKTYNYLRWPKRETD